MDPELAKRSLLCKWIMFALEPGESNLQSLLRYRLECFWPQRGGNWGPSLEWFTNIYHQSFSGSKIWGHITKAWHHMVKTLVPLPPRDLYGVLGFSIWWTWDIHLFEPVFSIDRAKELYLKGLRLVDDIWDMELYDFIPWQVAQDRFGLRDGEEEAWNLITRTIMNKWHNILENNWETLRPGTWVGLFSDHQLDPVLVCKTGDSFDPRCMVKTRVDLPIPTPCFRVGPQSRCIHEWTKPVGELRGSFMKCASLEPLEDKINKRCCSTMAREHALPVTQRGGYGITIP